MLRVGEQFGGWPGLDDLAAAHDDDAIGHVGDDAHVVRDQHDRGAEARIDESCLATLRAYQQAVALFCDYLVDPRYGWGERSMAMFGSHPVQIFHEWNTTAHVIETEARPQVRPLTRVEVQRLLDHADERAFQAYGSGRKGWVSAATRNCPETATKLPGGGHENCPLTVMGSARHDVVCLAALCG